MENGLFVMESGLPCNPNQIRFPKWLLPDTLGRMEREEAAARIISFSQQMDQWVGVSWPKLLEMMKADTDLIAAKQEENKRRFHDRQSQTFFKKFLNFLGFGKKKEVEEEITIPFTALLLYGPQAIVNGIHELLDAGFLKQEEIRDGEETVSVFFPTIKLVQTIMEKQNIAAA